MFNKVKDVAGEAGKGVKDLLFARDKEQRETTNQMNSNVDNVDERVNDFFNKNKTEVHETPTTTNHEEPMMKAVNTYSNEVFTNNSARVRICKPKTYEHVEVIGQEIKSGKVVILDMNRLDENLAMKILQFVYGICFAYDISPENVDSKIIAIDPQHKRKN